MQWSLAVQTLEVVHVEVLDHHLNLFPLLTSFLGGGKDVDIVNVGVHASVSMTLNKLNQFGLFLICWKHHSIWQFNHEKAAMAVPRVLSVTLTATAENVNDIDLWSADAEHTQCCKAILHDWEMQFLKIGLVFPGHSLHDMQVKAELPDCVKLTLSAPSWLSDLRMHLEIEVLDHCAYKTKGQLACRPPADAPSSESMLALGQALSLMVPMQVPTQVLAVGLLSSACPHPQAGGQDCVDVRKGGPGWWCLVIFDQNLDNVVLLCCSHCGPVVAKLLHCVIGDRSPDCGTNLGVSPQCHIHRLCRDLGKTKSPSNKGNISGKVSVTLTYGNMNRQQNGLESYAKDDPGTWNSNLNANWIILRFWFQNHSVSDPPFSDFRISNHIIQDPVYDPMYHTKAAARRCQSNILD